MVSTVATTIGPWGDKRHYFTCKSTSQLHGEEGSQYIATDFALAQSLPMPRQVNPQLGDSPPLCGGHRNFTIVATSNAVFALQHCGRANGMRTLLAIDPDPLH
ncbi:unnamed protein product [Hydatigera taeniaeformis]|uniref:DUF1559 domain-containing protein n=1 Tax=Hydatigena taeniaeformis TaxID=6205 RepID=A0A0R3WPG0_HYDTA|nr:unnamed protein product [Hydatigera taeniaeformis]